MLYLLVEDIAVSWNRVSQSFQSLSRRCLVLLLRLARPINHGSLISDHSIRFRSDITGGVDRKYIYISGSIDLHPIKQLITTTTTYYSEAINP